jgi:long-chain acyl-CoA synthetase
MTLPPCRLCDQGEYIAVEKLEATFKKCDLVEQVWVYGNSFKNSLVAVVVPKEKELLAWAKGNNVGGGFTEVAASEAAQAYVVEKLKETGKTDKLKGFEMVKKVRHIG